MAKDDPFGGLFKTAPQVVVDYFDRRPLKPSFSWLDVAPREHAIQFTVAKTEGFNVLGDIQAWTRKAVVDQIPFEEFRAGLEPKLRQAGWWGQKLRPDPKTGERMRVQLGSLARLKLIFDANIRSARAAGDWSRIQTNKEVLPYLEYMRSASERKRPLHLSWVGITLLVDDPWWRTHYPPNGWRCKCRVSQRAEPRDGTSPGKLKRPPLDLQPGRNRRTGRSELVPAGVDPGWQHNLGMERERLVGQRLVSRLDALQPNTRREAIARMREEPLNAYVVENGPRYDHARAGSLDQASIGRLRAPIASLSDGIAARLGAQTRTLTMTVETAAKQLHSRRGALAVADYDLVQTVIDAPDVILDDGNLVLWRAIDGAPWKLVLKRTAEDEVFLVSFRRDSDDQVGRPTRRRRIGDSEEKE